jgi:NUMOD3 motif
VTIYLYVKTHNKTGLKYLGKTESKDPHKYPGSGTYWKYHLKKHGKDYSTEIIKECESIEEFTKWGLYYSNLWNVVESNDWANLKEETGDARGKLSAESRRKIADAGLGREPWNKGTKGLVGYWKGKVRSDNDKEKISHGRKGKGLGHSRPHTNETIEKIKSARSLQIITEDHKKKIGDANRGKPKPKLTCPHCGLTGGASQLKQWHFDNCKSK